jgi:hypothetical protein
MIIRHATYHPYTPDQALLLPAAFSDAISPTDPVHAVRRAVAQLDLGAIHERLRAPNVGGRRSIPRGW